MSFFLFFYLVDGVWYFFVYYCISILLLYLIHFVEISLQFFLILYLFLILLVKNIIRFATIYFYSFCSIQPFIFIICKFDIRILANSLHIVIVGLLKLLNCIMKLIFTIRSFNFYPSQFTQSDIYIFYHIFSLSCLLEDYHFTLKKYLGRIELFLNEKL